jgi:HSP20 family protein
MLDDFFGDRFMNDIENSPVVKTWKPTSDVIEKKDEFLVKVEIPGVKKEDIKVELVNNLLNISGERKSHTEVKEENYTCIESFSGSFSRSFQLPDGIEESKIKVKLEDGVLNLNIPKPEKQKPKSIPITVQ